VGTFLQIINAFQKQNPNLFRSALIDWGLIMAAGMMITIPALLFFLSVQRYLIRGWGAGGVKG
jgi:ABC-type glycerol-3-phosphate transport system permease component